MVQMDALDEVKGFCIICLLVLNLLQIFLLCILFKKGDHKKFHIHLFLALIVFISIPIIEGYFWKVPSTFIIFFIIFICAFVFIFSAYIVSVFILEIRFSNGMAQCVLQKDPHPVPPEEKKFHRHPL